MCMWKHTLDTIIWIIYQLYELNITSKHDSLNKSL